MEIENTDTDKYTIFGDDFKHTTGGSDGGTGALSKHIREKHSIDWSVDLDKNQATLNSTTTGLLKYDEMKDTEELAKLFALGCLPFFVFYFFVISCYVYSNNL